MDDESILVVCADRERAGSVVAALSGCGRVRTAQGGTEALEWLVAGGFALAVVDLALPDLDPIAVCDEVLKRRLPVELLALDPDGGAIRAEKARALGLDVIALPCEPERIAFHAAGSLADRRSRAEVRDLERAARRGDDLRGLVTAGRRMSEVGRAVARLAPVAAPVLIVGAPGTGKLRLARALHSPRARRGGPLRVVPCADLTEPLQLRTLFVCDGGAVGAVAGAAGGTLVLRDVEALGPSVQARLAAAIAASGRGARAARLVATTSTSLPALVERGTFRAELLAALGSRRLVVPTLAERGAVHLARLIRLFEQRARLAGRAHRRLPRELVARLARQPWPGNLPELRRAVDEWLLAAPSPADRIAMPDPLLPDGAATADVLTLADRIAEHVHRLERAYLEAVLAACGGRVDRCADHCGVSRRTVGAKLRRLGIDKSRYKQTKGEVGTIPALPPAEAATGAASASPPRVARSRRPPRRDAT